MRVRMNFRQDPSSACGGFRMTIRGFLPLLQQPVERRCPEPAEGGVRGVFIMFESPQYYMQIHGCFRKMKKRQRVSFAPLPGMLAESSEKQHIAEFQKKIPSE